MKRVRVEQQTIRGSWTLEEYDGYVLYVNNEPILSSESKIELETRADLIKRAFKVVGVSDEY